MLKIDASKLAKLGKDYPGLVDDINRFEQMDLPPCPKCKSVDTASVQCGVIGRTITLCGATTKFKLVGNGPKPGNCFCNGCGEYFG